MVLPEVMSTELFKNSRTGFSEITYYTPVTHTNINYTVDTIALDSYEDVCGFCLWSNHPLCSASCCTMGSTVFVFPMDELCCVVMKSNCFKHRVILHYAILIESDLTPSILILSLPLTETTHVPETSQPHLQCSGVYRLSELSIQPVGLPGILTLVPVLIPHLNVGISVMEASYLCGIYRPCRAITQRRSQFSLLKEGWRVSDLRPQWR